MTDNYLSQMKGIKRKIDNRALKFIGAKKISYSYGNKGGTKDKLFERLSEFITRGKCIRGTLFYYIAKELGVKNMVDVIDFAVGLELIHSALLIHDDIMDNDLLRRGKPSIYAQYIPEINTNYEVLKTETAKSIAISVGDLAIFIAFELFNKSLRNNPRGVAIMSRIVKDYSLTGLGQIDDVFFSASNTEPKPEQICRVFLYKTARYTFSLPLGVAAMFAGKSDNLIKKLDSIGEHIGVIFQVRDDEIGLFGESDQIGKTVGVDIIKNNKTLIRYFLYQKSSLKERAELDKIFGNSKITKNDIDRLRNMFLKNGVAKKINKLKSSHISCAVGAIDKIENKNIKKSLNDLLLFLNNRNS